MIGIIDKIVLDASVLVKLIVREEYSEKVLKLIETKIDGKVELFAPSLIIYEIGNVIWRHREIDTDSMHEYIKHISSLGIKFMDLAFEEEILDETCKLSKSKDLTFYDAAYVSIAKVIGTKLLTADRMIISKAGEYVIPIEDFII
jgi:predicted nucleic acid-binding protein